MSGRLVSVRSVMATKSVRPALTPLQAIAVYGALKGAAWAPGDSKTSSRLFSARSAVASALYEDGWEMDDNGTWRKEVKGG